MKEICDAIEKKLTDNKEENIKYLRSELEKNKNNKEVVNFIFKKLFENLPENLQDNLVRNINQEKFEERLKEIQELIAHKKYERALDYLDMSIQKIEKVYEDDDYIYKTFHSPFEAYLYAYRREDKTKRIKNSELDFGVFHKFRGLILNELGRCDEAQYDFLESFKWNELDFEAIFGYAETLYKLGFYEDYLKWNLKTLKIAYTNFAIAMCYHNIGKYYMAKGTKEDDLKAFNIISYSISFEETEYAYRDLNTICEKYNLPKTLAKEREIFKTLEKEKLPQSPDLDLCKDLFEIAKSFINGNDQFALFVFRVLYNLTHDETVKAYIAAGEKAVKEKKAQN